MNVGYYQKRELTSIPNWIYEDDLNILHLYENNLHQSRELIIPENIDFLLTINDNKLRQMPSNTNALSKLEFLDACNNQISELTSDIGQMSSLKQLTICNNPLTSLNESIAEMKSLKWLWLSNCELKKIPESVCEEMADKKVEVHLEGNRFPYTYMQGGQLYFLNDRYISVNNKIMQTKDFNDVNHELSLKRLTSQILQRNGVYLKKEDNRTIALIKLIKENVDKTELYNILRVQDLPEVMEALPKVIEWDFCDCTVYDRLKKTLIDIFEQGSIELTVRHWFKKEKYKLYL